MCEQWAHRTYSICTCRFFEKQKRFCSAKRILPDQNADNGKWIFIMLKCSSMPSPFISCDGSISTEMESSVLRWDSTRVLVRLADGSPDALYLCKLPRHRIDALKTVQIYLTSFVWYVLRNGARKSGKIHTQANTIVLSVKSLIIPLSMYTVQTLMSVAPLIIYPILMGWPFSFLILKDFIKFANNAKLVRRKKTALNEAPLLLTLRIKLIFFHRCFSL